MSAQPLTAATPCMFISFPATDLSVGWLSVKRKCVSFAWMPNEAVFLWKQKNKKREKSCLHNCFREGNKPATSINDSPAISVCSLFPYPICPVLDFCWNIVYKDKSCLSLVFMYYTYQMTTTHRRQWCPTKRKRQNIGWKKNFNKLFYVSWSYLWPNGTSFWWPSMSPADITTLINLRATLLVGVRELLPVMSLSSSTECSVLLPAVVRRSREEAGLHGGGCGQHRHTAASRTTHTARQLAKQTILRVKHTQKN